MQQLLASLVVAMSVKDAAFTSGMAAARREAERTGQDFEKSGDRMGSVLERAARKVNDAMLSIADAVAEANRKVIAAGAAMTVGLTVPIAMMGKSAKDTAATFEAAMNGVRAAMLSATPDQIEQLSQAARTMGPAFGKSASEAAAAIEGLAKTGLSAAAILDGGLKSALTLGVVGQTDLGRATAITTDIMAQFGRTASELPAITNRVVGALDATKMGADDYAQAIGQVGGVAGGLGYTFEDTNVAIAALATSFDSGSSAGTGLKSLLLQLKPTSKDAEKVMERLGKAIGGQAVSFFDAQKNAKSFAETAEILRTSFGRLNEESKREALTKAFGSDGMQAALALMDKGAKGMDDLRRSIDGVTADQKLAVLLEGDAAASQRLSSAVESLSIAIGSILLPAFTWVKNAAADVIQWMSELPPVFHYAWVAAGTLAAAFGPLVVAAGLLAKVALALLAARFAAIPIVLGLIINPLGVVIGLLGRLAVAMGASAAIGLFAARLATMATGIGLVVTVATVLIPLLFRTGQATDAARIAQDKATEAYTLAAQKTEQLALASGKLRDKLLEEAKAARQSARDTMLKARADVIAAKAAAVRAREETGKVQFSTPGAAGAVTGNIVGRSQTSANAEAEYKARLTSFSTLFDTFDLWDRKIKEAESNAKNDTGGLGLDLSDPEKKRKGPKGRDAARDNAQYLDELGRLRVQALEAQAELTGSIEARYRADMASIAEERASFARNIALDEGLTDAKRATLLDAQKAVLDRRAQQADQARTVALEQDRYELQVAAIEAQQDIVRSEIDAADSIAARRAGQLRLLALDRQYEEAVLDQILATKKTTDIEWSKANARKGQLDAIYADREAATRRDNEGPLASWRRNLNRSAEAVNESIEAIEVSGFERLNDWMTDAVMGADNLAQAFKNMTKSIIADLVRIMIQQQLIKPLANALGGGLGSLFGGGSANPLGLGNALAPMNFDVGAALSYGGGKASGGRVSPGSWYMVGENGREAFVPDSAGTIMPNSALNGGGDNGRVIVDVMASPLLIAEIRREASTQATAVTLDSQRTQAKRARNQMGTGRR